MVPDQKPNKHAQHCGGNTVTGASRIRVINSPMAAWSLGINPTANEHYDQKDQLISFTILGAAFSYSPPKRKVR